MNENDDIVTSRRADRKQRLTPRRALFCMEYLIDLNGAQAAIRAGYSAQGARQTAQRLLTYVDIRREIDRLLAEKSKKLDFDQERVLQGIAQLAFFDIRTLFNADGSLKTMAEMPDCAAAAITSFEVEELYERGESEPVGTVHKVRLADRGLNLERLGRYFKLFTDRKEISGLDDLAEAIRKGRLRLQGITED